MNASMRAEQELARRLQDILTRDFIVEKLCPVLPELSYRCAPLQDLRATVVQNTGTGRVTVKYQLGHHMTVFGKLYTDDLGVYSYAVLQRLWEREFGRDAGYRVSEPLSYLSEYRLLLTKEAPGINLESLASEGGSAFLNGMGKAARWLAKLHASSLRLGRPEELWVKFFKLGRSIAKTSQKRPSHAEELLNMMAKLEKLARNVSDSALVVQTHGRFLQEHVFIDDGAVTVIDLDRSSPADAAQDVAEFLYMMRLRAFKLTGDQTQSAIATRLFLEEYIAHLPNHVRNLAFFWAYNILYSLARFMRRHAPHEPAWQPMLNFMMDEFNDISSGKLPGCPFRLI